MRISAVTQFPVTAVCTVYTSVALCIHVMVAPCAQITLLHLVLKLSFHHVLWLCHCTVYLIVALCIHVTWLHHVHMLYRCTVYLVVALCSRSLHHVLTLHRWSCSGLFLYPTIFTDVTDDMFIAAEESFGPVMIISRFDDGSARTK